MNRGSATVSAEIAAAIMLGPIGAKQICLSIGIPAHRTDNLGKHLRAFRKAGLVYIHSYSKMRRAQYAWQPSLFAMPDAEIPPRKHKPKNERVPRVEANFRPSSPSSVFSMGAA